MVRFALRYEMARGLEDVLARRSRLLFLDAARAAELIEAVAALIEEELGRSVGADERQAFAALAQRYLSLP
jgi:glycerol-3-phosphate dehydrogenase